MKALESYDRHQSVGPTLAKPLPGHRSIVQRNSVTNLPPNAALAISNRADTIWVDGGRARSVIIVAALIVGGALVARTAAAQSQRTYDAQHQTVPVTIKSVLEGTLNPATRTILTVKTEDGRYIRNEVIPGPDGTAEITLPPGKYRLSAIGASQSLLFEVAPPRTIITIQVSNSGPPTVLAQTMIIPLGSSGHFLGGDVNVSVLAINSNGTPPVGKATFKLTAGGETEQYDSKEVGFHTQLQGFEVYLDRIGTEGANEAAFRVTLKGAERGVGPDKILAFSFGVAFVIVMLVIAVLDRDPSPMGIVIYRVVLALAAAGIGAVIPGMIDVNAGAVVRAGGALALFVIVFWFRPANLVAGPQSRTSHNGASPSEPAATPAKLPDGTPFPAEQREAFFRVWRALSTLERSGEDLWNHISDQTLSAFAAHRSDAEMCIAENALFFSDEDYAALRETMTAADFYLRGKTRLSDIRNGVVRSDEVVQLAAPGQKDRFVDGGVNHQIQQNKRWLTRYRNLLTDLRSSLRRGISV